MIDDIDEANKLLMELKGYLPIDAYPTKKLYLRLKFGNKLKINKKKLLTINDVHYLDDAGGIGCEITNLHTNEVILASITQMRLVKDHPLTQKVLEYTSNRISKLRDLE